MRRVFVLDANKIPLMPCYPARARQLLRNGKAKVFRVFPFTIILVDRLAGSVQTVEERIDPGSKTTGIALVGKFKKGDKVIFAAHLLHRGDQIRDALSTRRALRRARRQRNTRYRKARFDNRVRSKKWLPPSLQSGVFQIRSWTQRFFKIVPIVSIAVETVRFDTQKMENPEISGIEYQQGDLQGYEVREYILEKWQRKCAYCDKQDIPLEIEHIRAKSLGGSDRISNLTLACRKCNLAKANLSVERFVKNKLRLEKILTKAKSTLKDAAAVNAIRYAVGNSLKNLGFPVSFWSGGRTKYNRIQQAYKKEHWIDAACVGEDGKCVFISPACSPLWIKNTGRGSRQMCRVDRFGFPRGLSKSEKRPFNFQTGDLVKASVPKGKKKGFHVGRIAVRSSGNFNIQTDSSVVQGISYRHCRIMQRSDGYNYGFKPWRLPPSAKAEGIRRLAN